MKIKHLHIVNYKAISEINIDCANQFNVIIGSNGVGKTTILSAISILYSWLFARIRGINSKGRTIPLSSIREGEDYSYLSITLEYKDQEYFWSLYKQKSGIHVSVDYKTDLSQLASLIEQVQGVQDTFNSLPTLVTYNINRNVTVFNSIFRKSNVKHSGLLEDGSRADWRSFFGWFVEKENEENRMKVHISPEYKDSELESVRKVVNKIFGSTFRNIYVHPKRKTLVIEKDGHIINFLDLSDGEKCYLALIMDISRRLDAISDEGMVVLIDEADLHLHPEWQLSFVDNLRRAFPTCQFFLTTHSSLLLSDLKSDYDEQLWVLQEGRRIMLSGSSYGDDTSYILKRYFGLKTVRNPQIQEMINAISDELSKESTNISQVESWMKELDDLDVQYDDSARYKLLLGIKKRNNEKDN